jgi:hypothetical protein
MATPRAMGSSGSLRGSLVDFGGVGGLPLGPVGVLGMVLYRTPSRGLGRLGKRRVTDDQKQENFLSKAKEAEELAEKAKNPRVRDAWLKIAQNYRRLAGLEAGA